MKKIISIFICCFCAVAALASLPLATVKSVELNKYAGEWYEIAKYPNWFQRNCAGTKAKYVLVQSGMIGVINTCQKKNNPKLLETATGKARVADTKTNAKLKVSFLPFGVSLFEGDYWILYLDENYQTAIVGTPNRKYLWFLSRTAQISETKYSQLSKIAEEKGFDPKKISKTSPWIE